MQLIKGLYQEEVVQEINHNLNRRDSGVDGMGKTELAEKRGPGDCRRNSQEAGSQLLEIKAGRRARIEGWAKSKKQKRWQDS